MKNRKSLSNKDLSDEPSAAAAKPRSAALPIQNPASRKAEKPSRRPNRPSRPKVARRPIARAVVGTKAPADSPITQSYDQQYSDQSDDRYDAVQYLRSAYCDRGLVVYLGAGVSQSAKLPGWNELLLGLMREIVNRSSNGNIQSDDHPAAASSILIQELEKFKGFDQSGPILGRLIKDVLGLELLPITQRFFLNRIMPGRNFGPDELPSAAELLATVKSDLIDALVELLRPRRSVRGVDAVVTYNYDNLLEDKLGELGVSCVPVLSERQKVPRDVLPLHHVHGWIPLTREARDERELDFFVDRVALLPSPTRDVLLRIYDGRANVSRAIVEAAVEFNRKVEWITDQYGRALDQVETLASLPDQQQKKYGNFVFSEDEYHREYGDPFRWSNLTQVSLMTRQTSLMVGLSMTDPNLRRLLDLTHQAAPSIRRFAIVSRRLAKDTENNPLPNLAANITSMETTTLRKIGVTPIWVDSHKEVPAILKEIVDIEE